MSKPIPIHRARSFSKPKRDPSQDAFAKLLDTVEGRNLPPKRKLPPLDAKQVVQMLVIATSKEPCFICQEKSCGVGMYNPPVELARYAPSFVLYSLCADCKVDVTTPAKVADRLVRQIQDKAGLMIM